MYSQIGSNGRGSLPKTWWMRCAVSGLALSFAGNAYLQVPLTTDYGALQLFIKSANPEMVQAQGTAIGDAISLAVRSNESGSKKHQAIIIISDGENHDVEAPAIAKKSNEDGLLPIHRRGGHEERLFYTGNNRRSAGCEARSNRQSGAH